MKSLLLKCWHACQKAPIPYRSGPCYDQALAYAVAAVLAGHVPPPRRHGADPKKGGGRQLRLPAAQDWSKGSSGQAYKEARVFSNREKRFRSRSVIAAYKLLSSGRLLNQFARWLQIEVA
jgi:hypothetical protein